MSSPSKTKSLFKDYNKRISVISPEMKSKMKEIEEQVQNGIQ